MRFGFAMPFGCVYGHEYDMQEKSRLKNTIYNIHHREDTILYDRGKVAAAQPFVD